MTDDAALFGAIDLHIESRARECPRIRRRLDWRARRKLTMARWCKATKRSEAEYANAAAEWHTAQMQAAMARAA